MTPLRPLNTVSTVATVFKAAEADRQAVQEKVAVEMDILSVHLSCGRGVPSHNPASETIRINRQIYKLCRRCAWSLTSWEATLSEQMR